MVLFTITRTRIININPTSIGGIICVDKGEINFKYNEVSNIISSTTAACCYVTSSKISIENSCFSRCAGQGSDNQYGNVGDIRDSSVKIYGISTFQCSFSKSHCADSVLRMYSCSSLIEHYNSSFCLGNSGSASFRSDANSSLFDVKFLTCASGADWSSLECNHAVYYERCAFINTTKITSYIVAPYKDSILDTCYFFLMAETTPRFRYDVSLINCCSDEAIEGYSLTVYANANDVIFPIFRKPSCKVAIICSCRRNSRKSTLSVNLIVMILVCCNH